MNIIESIEYQDQIHPEPAYRITAHLIEGPVPTKPPKSWRRLHPHFTTFVNFPSCSNNFSVFRCKDTHQELTFIASADRFRVHLARAGVN